jgi:Integrase core domain
MDLGHRPTAVKFLIRDRAGQFTSSFDTVLTSAAIRVLASPPQAPRANAICERVIGTLRREFLDRLLVVNEHHLRQVLTEYLLHYNTARPHRSLGQLTPDQAGSQPPASLASPSTGSPGPQHPGGAGFGALRGSGCGLVGRGVPVPGVPSARPLRVPA